MVTYEAVYVNMLFQFGLLFVTTVAAIVAIITLVTNKTKK